jgi:phospholipid/cholesterol/gamma-HCH transport system ATP-binding protein
MTELIIPMPHEKPMIEFKDVCKAFGSHKVLNGINFTIPKGQITYIIGCSGEGKSVILKHIVGLLKPDAGKILISQKDMTGASLKEWNLLRTRLGILFQYAALFDSETVYNNVEFPLRYLNGQTGPEVSKTVLGKLRLLGVEALKDKYPSELSIGEKKRVGLARALALEPDILLYDEPSTSMDPFVCEMLDNLIIETQKKFPSLTTVVVSHDVTSILKVPHKIIFLNKGICHFSGPRAHFRTCDDATVQQFIYGKEVGPLGTI